MLRRLEPLRSFTLPSDVATRSGVTVVHVYADGHKLLAGTPYLLVVLDAVTGAQERTLHRWQHGKAGSEGAVSGAGISHDGARAVVCFGTPEMVRWDLQGKATAQPLVAPGGRVGVSQAVSFAADGRRVLTGDCGYKTLRLWDARSGELLRQVRGKVSVGWNAALSPDGTRAVAGGAGKTLFHYDLERGVELAAMAGHTGAIRGVAFSPDAQRAVSVGADGTARLWDLAAGGALAVLKVLRRAVTAVAWSPDGRTIATGDADGAVGYWDAASGERRAGGDDGAEVAALSFAPDGSFLASGGAEVRLWPAPA